MAKTGKGRRPVRRPARRDVRSGRGLVARTVRARTSAPGPPAVRSGIDSVLRTESRMRQARLALIRREGANFRVFRAFNIELCFIATFRVVGHLPASNESCSSSRSVDRSRPPSRVRPRRSNRVRAADQSRRGELPARRASRPAGRHAADRRRIACRDPGPSGAGKSTLPQIVAGRPRTVRYPACANGPRGRGRHRRRTPQ